MPSGWKMRHIVADFGGRDVRRAELIPSDYSSYRLSLPVRGRKAAGRRMFLIPHVSEHHFVTRKSTLLKSVRLGVITSTLPVVAPVGTEALISELEATLNIAG